ncbi:MAG: 4Fe-4S binding protein [bacterium]
MKEIVIISGKGGTGKTTLTASLAALYKNNVIADCDVDAADLHLLLDPDIKKTTEFKSGVEAVIAKDICTACGKCREVCKYNAISPDYVVNKIDCEGCAVCYFFCPDNAITLRERHCGEWYLSETRFGPFIHARLGIAAENSGKLVSLIRRQAKLLAEERGLNTILVDGSPGIGCPVISSITGASLVVVVTEPTVSGVHDMERVMGVAKHFQIPAVVVINKSDLNEEMSREIEIKVNGLNSPVIGHIPYDSVVTHAMVQGKTVVEFSDGPLIKEIQKIGQTVLNYV